MAVGRRVEGQDGKRGLVILAAFAALSACLILLLAEFGGFSSLGRNSTRLAIPGVTIDDSDGAPLPVVTSVESDSEASRLGVLAGDAVLAVDGHPVTSAAALRATVVQADPHRPVDLHLRRGDAIWDVSIGRLASRGPAIATGSAHDTKDPTD